MTEQLLTALQALSLAEGVAVVLALAYLVLAAAENIWCWPCALVSTAIYTWLFWDVSLPMQSALNVFYLLMAVYGWYQWRLGGGDDRPLTIRTLPLSTHVAIIIGVLVMTVASGALLTSMADSAWPFVDAFVTWGSVVTTVMVARKILENWLYWLVIDAVAVPLYFSRELYLTAVLFVIYLVIVVQGYRTWRKHLQS
ncbi:MAG: nicotinamide mononucleotide transporter [Gammaproteobacteria bacterium]|nr:nicotinamide mononucleotide transporter [Gammaproteobacteria bacterium]